MWSFLLILVAVVAYASKQILEFLYRRKCVANLPSAPAHILAKNVAHFRYKTNKEYSRMMENIIGSMDITFKFWIGPMLTVFLQEKDDIKTVLLQCLEKSIAHDLMPTFAHGSIISSKVSKWRLTRRDLSPCFFPAVLRAAIPIFNRNASKLVTVIDEMATSGRTFDMIHLMYEANFNNITESVFDTHANMHKEHVDNVIDSLKRSSSAAFKRISRIFNMSDIVWKAKKDYRIAERCSNTLRKHIAKVRETVDLRRSLFQSTESAALVIHKLLQRRDAGEITTGQVDLELGMFIIGGIETSAMTMAMSVLMLAMHPTVQARIHAEIAALNCTTTNVNHADTVHMPYTEMVLKETLRLFPPVPYMGRLVDRNIRLGKCTLPQGTIAIIPVHHIHRRAALWGHDHDQFVPERFSPERSHEFDPFFFMPFSHGTRNCIGTKYAMMSMKIFICHLVTQFEFHTHMLFNELDMRRETMLHMNSDYAVTARRR